MKALTIRQPWAWAIARGFKDVENRRQAYNYVGPVMIHAGQQLADVEAFRTVAKLAGEEMPQLGLPGGRTEAALGAVIAVAEITSVHRSNECGASDFHEGCSPWGQPFHAHHMIRNVRLLKCPVEARGNTILWTPSADLVTAVKAELR